MMDIDNEREVYTDRWERIISTDSAGDGVSVTNAEISQRRIIYVCSERSDWFSTTCNLEYKKENDVSLHSDCLNKDSVPPDFEDAYTTYIDRWERKIVPDNNFKDVLVFKQPADQSDLHVCSDDSVINKNKESILSSHDVSIDCEDHSQLLYMSCDSSSNARFLETSDVVDNPKNENTNNEPDKFDIDSYETQRLCNIPWYLDTDAEKSQTSNRYLEKRKTFEVNICDLSGTEARHVSHLDFTVRQEPDKNCSPVSQLNFSVNKTTDTEEFNSIDGDEDMETLISKNIVVDEITRKETFGDDNVQTVNKDNSVVDNISRKQTFEDEDVEKAIVDNTLVDEITRKQTFEDEDVEKVIVDNTLVDEITRKQTFEDEDVEKVIIDNTLMDEIDRQEKFEDEDTESAITYNSAVNEINRTGIFEEEDAHTVTEDTSVVHEINRQEAYENEDAEKVMGDNSVVGEITTKHASGDKDMETLIGDNIVVDEITREKTFGDDDVQTVCRDNSVVEDFTRKDTSEDEDVELVISDNNATDEIIRKDTSEDEDVELVISDNNATDEIIRKDTSEDEKDVELAIGEKSTADEITRKDTSEDEDVELVISDSRVVDEISEKQTFEDEDVATVNRGNNVINEISRKQIFEDEDVKTVVRDSSVVDETTRKQTLDNEYVEMVYRDNSVVNKIDKQETFEDENVKTVKEDKSAVNEITRKDTSEDEDVELAIGEKSAADEITSKDTSEDEKDVELAISEKSAADESTRKDTSEDEDVELVISEKSAADEITRKDTSEDEKDVELAIGEKSAADEITRKDTSEDEKDVELAIGEKSAADEITRKDTSEDEDVELVISEKSAADEITRKDTSEDEKDVELAIGEKSAADEITRKDTSEDEKDVELAIGEKSAADEITRKDTSEDEDVELVISEKSAADEITRKDTSEDEDVELVISEKSAADEITRKDTSEDEKDVELAISEKSAANEITRKDTSKDEDVELAINEKSAADEITSKDTSEDEKDVELAISEKSAADEITRKDTSEDEDVELVISEKSAADEITRKDTSEDEKDVELAISEKSAADEITRKDTSEDEKDVELAIGEKSAADEITRKDTSEDEDVELVISEKSAADEITRKDTSEDEDVELVISEKSAADEITRKDTSEDEKDVELAISEKSAANEITRKDTSKDEDVELAISEKSAADEITRKDTSKDEDVELAISEKSAADEITRKDTSEDEDVELVISDSRVVDEISEKQTFGDEDVATVNRNNTVVNEVSRKQIFEDEDVKTVVRDSIVVDETTRKETFDNEYVEMVYRDNSVVNKIDKQETFEDENVKTVNGDKSAVNEITRKDTSEDEKDVELAISEKSVADEITRKDTSENEDVELAISEKSAADEITRKDTSEDEDVELAINEKSAADEITSKDTSEDEKDVELAISEKSAADESTRKETSEDEDVELVISENSAADEITRKDTSEDEKDVELAIGEKSAADEITRKDTSEDEKDVELAIGEKSAADEITRKDTSEDEKDVELAISEKSAADEITRKDTSEDEDVELVISDSHVVDEISEKQTFGDEDVATVNRNNTVVNEISRKQIFEDEDVKTVVRDSIVVDETTRKETFDNEYVEMVYRNNSVVNKIDKQETFEDENVKTVNGDKSAVNEITRKDTSEDEKVVELAISEKSAADEITRKDTSENEDVELAIGEKSAADEITSKETSEDEDVELAIGGKSAADEITRKDTSEDEDVELAIGEKSAADEITRKDTSEDEDVELVISDSRVVDEIAEKQTFGDEDMATVNRDNNVINEITRKQTFEDEDVKAVVRDSIVVDETTRKQTFEDEDVKTVVRDSIVVDETTRKETFDNKYVEMVYRDNSVVNKIDRHETFEDENVKRVNGDKSAINEITRKDTSEDEKDMELAISEKSAANEITRKDTSENEKDVELAVGEKSAADEITRKDTSEDEDVELVISDSRVVDEISEKQTFGDEDVATVNINNTVVNEISRKQIFEDEDVKTVVRDSIVVDETTRKETFDNEYVEMVYRDNSVVNKIDKQETFEDENVKTVNGDKSAVNEITRKDTSEDEKDVELAISEKSAADEITRKDTSEDEKVVELAISEKSAADEITRKDTSENEDVELAIGEKSAADEITSKDTSEDEKDVELAIGEKSAADEITSKDTSEDEDVELAIGGKSAADEITRKDTSKDEDVELAISEKSAADEITRKDTSEDEKDVELAISEKSAADEITRKDTSKDEDVELVISEKSAADEITSKDTSEDEDVELAIGEKSAADEITRKDTSKDEDVELAISEKSAADEITRKDTFEDEDVELVISEKSAADEITRKDTSEDEDVELAIGEKSAVNEITRKDTSEDEDVELAIGGKSAADEITRKDTSEDEDVELVISEKSAADEITRKDTSEDEKDVELAIGEKSAADEITRKDTSEDKKDVELAISEKSAADEITRKDTSEDEDVELVISDSRVVDEIAEKQTFGDEDVATVNRDNNVINEITRKQTFEDEDVKTVVRDSIVVDETTRKQTFEDEDEKTVVRDSIVVDETTRKETFDNKYVEMVYRDNSVVNKIDRQETFEDENVKMVHGDKSAVNEITRKDTSEDEKDMELAISEKSAANEITRKDTSEDEKDVELAISEKSAADEITRKDTSEDENVELVISEKSAADEITRKDTSEDEDVELVISDSRVVDEISEKQIFGDEDVATVNRDNNVVNEITRKQTFEDEDVKTIVRDSIVVDETTRKQTFDNEYVEMIYRDNSVVNKIDSQETFEDENVKTVNGDKSAVNEITRKETFEDENVESINKDTNVANDIARKQTSGDEDVETVHMGNTTVNEISRKETVEDIETVIRDNSIVDEIDRHETFGDGDLEAIIRYSIVLEEVTIKETFEEEDETVIGDSSLVDYIDRKERYVTENLETVTRNALSRQIICKKKDMEPGNEYIDVSDEIHVQTKFEEKDVETMNKNDNVIDDMDKEEVFEKKDAESANNVDKNHRQDNIEDEHVAKIAKSYSMIDVDKEEIFEMEHVESVRKDSNIVNETNRQEKFEEKIVEMVNKDYDVVEYVGKQEEKYVALDDETASQDASIVDHIKRHELLVDEDVETRDRHNNMVNDVFRKDNYEEEDGYSVNETNPFKAAITMKMEQEIERPELLIQGQSQDILTSIKPTVSTNCMFTCTEENIIADSVSLAFDSYEVYGPRGIMLQYNRDISIDSEERASDTTVCKKISLSKSQEPFQRLDILLQEDVHAKLSSKRKTKKDEIGASAEGIQNFSEIFPLHLPGNAEYSMIEVRSVKAGQDSDSDMALSKMSDTTLDGGDNKNKNQGSSSDEMKNPAVSEKGESMMILKPVQFNSRIEKDRCEKTNGKYSSADHNVTFQGNEHFTNMDVDYHHILIREEDSFENMEHQFSVQNIKIETTNDMMENNKRLSSDDRRLSSDDRSKYLTGAHNFELDSISKGDGNMTSFDSCNDVDISLNTDVDYEIKGSSDFDKTRKYFTSLVGKKHLLEDINSSKSRAEQILAQNPVADQEHVIQTLSSGKTAFTSITHLISEIVLLQTAARDQQESLKLAVSEKEKYETEISYLNNVIAEAGKKMEHSPVSVTSVGALKQQITEQNPYSKEDELQTHHQSQERYQQSVRSLVIKMKEADIKLAENAASIHVPLENQMVQYKEQLTELQDIEADISHVRDVSEGLMNHLDSECQKTVEATLMMLNDRFNHLKTMADNKGKQLKVLQNSQHMRERCITAQKLYEKEVQNLQEWIEEKKACLVTPVLDVVPADLQEQLDENRDLLKEISVRLQQMHDLTLHCEAMAENESLASAETQRKLLTALQSDLTHLKFAAQKKHTTLQAANRELEGKKRERGETSSCIQEQEMKKLLSEAKELILVSGIQAVTITPEQLEIHKELATDIKIHRQLVSQICDQESQVSTSSLEVLVSGDKMEENWERFQRHLAEKRDQLETCLRTKSSTNPLKVSVQTQVRHVDLEKEVEKVKNITADASESWKKMLKQTDKEQFSSHAAVTFQQQYMFVLESISSCLDVAEQQLLIMPATIEEQIRQTENLQRYIESLQRDIVTVNRQAQDLIASSDLSCGSLIKICLSTLDERSKLLKVYAELWLEDLYQAGKQWNQFQDEVRQLQRQIQDIQQLIMIPASTQSVNQLLSDNQKTQVWLMKCEVCLEELKRKEFSLTKEYPKEIFTSELATLHLEYKELHRMAKEKDVEVQNILLARDQYQKMLSDYEVFLEIAQSKFCSNTITVRNLNHLKQLLKTHIDFFADLERHKAMVDSLASQCNPATRDEFKQKHSSLSRLTQALMDQASLYGHRLMDLTNQWIELDEKYIRLQNILTHLESQIFVLVLSDDSLVSIQDKSSSYKELLSELAGEREMVLETVNKGKQLLNSISCPCLESAVTNLAKKWTSLNTSLANELERTETLSCQLSSFETETSELSSWLTTAQINLSSFVQSSSQATLDMKTVQERMEKILELNKEVENRLSLKNKIITKGTQLVQNKYDTQGLQDILHAFEEKWMQLEEGIAKAQKYLHGVQIGLMPSLQTLSELTAWVEEISKLLQTDARVKITTISDLENMIRIFKGYKTELSSKQLLLDIVNQQVLTAQTDGVDIESERQDFAEKLAEVNKGYKIVVAEVADKLFTLEVVQSKWEEFERALMKLQSWLRDQEDKIKHCRLTGQEAGMKLSLMNINKIQQELKSKKIDLISLEILGNHLTELHCVMLNCQRSVEESLSALDQNWKKLEEQAMQVEDLLTARLGLWTQYHAGQVSLRKIITQTEFDLNHCTNAGGDIETVKFQMERLKSLRSDIDASLNHLESFSALACKLSEICDQPVQADIQRNVSELQTKLEHFIINIDATYKRLEQCFNQWQKLENQYRKICDWLESKENFFTKLPSRYSDPQRIPQSVIKCRQLQQELDNFQAEFSELNRINDQLTQNMKPATTITLVMGRQLLVEQRLLAIRQKLSQHTDAHSLENYMLTKFSTASEDVKNFLNHSERILASDDPTEEAAIQSKLDQLKQLLLSFSINSTKLDAVNNIGYSLALDEAQARQLRELNHEWQRQYEDAKDRSRILQSTLLLHQDFTSKCKAWMTFLAQAEQHLAMKIKGNLVDLIDQFKRCEEFESEVYSQQQILHAIISDGDKIWGSGNVERREELVLLSDQWQSMCKRINQRKSLIKELTRKWQEFDKLCQQMRDWLKEKEDLLCECDSDSLQVIRNLMANIQAVKCEIKLKETIHKNIQDMGDELLLHADATTSEEIKSTILELQRHWERVTSSLDDKWEHLNAVDSQWQECEEDIKDILNWLKNICSFLHTDLPTTYDALQADLNRCREIKIEFMNSQVKPQCVLAKEKQLRRQVQASEINLLQHRIQLLNKQWKELEQQNSVREQALSESLNRWTNFTQSIKLLMDWIDDMVVNVMSTRDAYIEDLLAKLKYKYKEEMQVKEVQKNSLMEQGRHLMRISNEIRASDIEQKLWHLENKWQRLKEVTDFRQSKLEKTVSAVSQLDTGMKNLNLWMSYVENVLNKEISVEGTALEEVQTKLQENQDLQQDMEHHSAGVSAVLNLCEVLLNDSDACATKVEFMALQHTMKNLKKRWQKICALVLKNKTRVQEIWQQGSIFRKESKKVLESMTQPEHDMKKHETDALHVDITEETVEDISTTHIRMNQHFQTATSYGKELRDAQATYKMKQRPVEMKQVLEELSPQSLAVKHRPDPIHGLSSHISSHGRLMELTVESSDSSESLAVGLRSSTPMRFFSSPRSFSPSPDKRSPSSVFTDVSDGQASPGHFSAHIKSAKIEVIIEQLVDALSDCDAKLKRLEKAKDVHSSQEQILQYSVECEIAVDNVQKLNQLLKTESGAVDSGSTRAEVKHMVQRWTNLQRWIIGQDTEVFHESQDLFHFFVKKMLIWLDESEALLSVHKSLVSDVAKLDIVLEQFKVFLVTHKCKKAILQSINDLSMKYLEAKSPEIRRRRDHELSDMNLKWKRIFSKANSLKRELQAPVFGGQRYMQQVHHYNVWLENIETKVHQCEPINLNMDVSSLVKKHVTLAKLRDELQLNQAKVFSLKETAELLECPEPSVHKIYTVHNNMKTLVPLVLSYISALENRLQIVPNRGNPSDFDMRDGRSSSDGNFHQLRSSASLHSGPVISKPRDRLPPATSQPLLSGVMPHLVHSSMQEKDNLSTELETATVPQHTKHPNHPGLLTRVIRAALPIHLLFLLLFLLFTLIPVCEDEYSCMFSNNQWHSFSPMLRYTDGAPPT